MIIEILPEAKNDLIDGYWYYEDREPGLGEYFKACLYTDIETLENTGGIHPAPYKGLHRALSDRFPYAIYYKVDANKVLIRAVIDCRRSDEWIANYLE